MCRCLLWHTGTDVSERSAGCIFTVKDEGTFAPCFLSCASAEFLSGRRFGHSGREIIALYICTAFRRASLLPNLVNFD
jgi:hypothetical protein